MIRIILLKRTTKKEGKITLRFRLLDGRDVELFHKSDIKADIKDLTKFDKYGDILPKVQLYNRALKRDLDREIEYIKSAYEKMKEEGYDMSSDVLERLIHEKKDPIEAERDAGATLINAFQDYIDASYKDGVIGKPRHRHLMVVHGKLNRFLTIKRKSKITCQEFDGRMLMEFRNFVFDEYSYVERHPSLYKKMTKKAIPTARLSMNTVSSQMKMLQAFFSNLEESQDIKSPFIAIGRKGRKQVMKTLYDEPVFLRQEEFHAIIEAELPLQLRAVRDAFILQCFLGCRIGDFAALTMENVSVSDGGIPYIHYLPSKTKMTQADNKEITTPLVKDAFRIIMKYSFIFPEIRYIYGEKGYNAKIKELLEYCGIDRRVPIFNEEKLINDYIPIYILASSKLCRKTHVDILNKVQVDMYAAGLHRRGSSAVNRYTYLELEDRFALMNVAFCQEDYRVDKNLNIIL